MQVDVINTALGFLGKEPVADLSETSLASSVAAVKLMRSIETSRATVLRRHGWLCALEYASLTPAIGPGFCTWRYPIAFLAPGAALRVWEIAGQLADGREWGGEPRWELGTVETGSDAQIVIRVGRRWGDWAGCADGNLNIAYVRLANWAALDPHVADAIAVDCAWRQCNSITGDKALTAQLQKAKEDAVQMAISVDGTQTGGQPPLASSIPAAIRRFAGASEGWGGWTGRDWGY